MADGIPTTAGRFALAYVAGALLLAGYAAWHYLMGHYARILLPTLLALLLVVAAVLRLTVANRPRIPAYLTLIAGYLLLAMELPWLETSASLWVGLAPVLPVLLLPLAPALLLNAVMAPAWLLLSGEPLDGDLTLSYLAAMTLVPLALWEQRRQRALLLATDPRDADCQALSREGLHAHLASEFQRTELLHQPLAILVIHLPQVEMASEQFGNRARQALLDTLCREVSRCSRRHDFLGRQTPATFWLVLPDTSESGAQLVQQRILQALEPVVLLDTGPLRTHMGLCQRLPGESWQRLHRRLLEFTRRLEAQ
ncbi:GGDEF domain-containing protein [Halomonas sp. NO4]|uniref:GGDEF domain-containing protein n=1 Tax=Halomonas sp. NO4 TaxID=2484813 RepID=UPI0013D02DED|nr:GGDEF domain-containing protein [Halomonas sp. NO4]